jgi:predicted alpha/beta hydrolase family esterase
VLLAAFPAALLHSWLPNVLARPPKPRRIITTYQKILAVHSTDDWRVPLRPNQTWLKENVRAHTHEVQHAGHFSGRDGWIDWTPDLYATVEAFLGFHYSQPHG